MTKHSTYNILLILLFFFLLIFLAIAEICKKELLRKRFQILFSQITKKNLNTNYIIHKATISAVKNQLTYY